MKSTALRMKRLRFDFRRDPRHLLELITRLFIDENLCHFADTFVSQVTNTTLFLRGI